MDKVFWLEPGRLGGRAGPNRHPWSLLEFSSNGVTLVVSLSERMYNTSHEFAAFEMDHVCIALPKSAPPKPGDGTEIAYLLPCIYDVVANHLALGEKRVIVHCSSGKDRTGLFFVYYLMRTRSLSFESALETVSAIVPRLLTAEGWRDMSRSILKEPEPTSG